MGESIVNEDVTKKEDCGVDVDGVRVNKLFRKMRNEEIQILDTLLLRSPLERII